MKLSTAAATILFLEAWSSNKNLAFGEYQGYLGNVTKQSEGCSWLYEYVGKGAIVEVTGCTGTFIISLAFLLGEIHIPADSGVDSVEITFLGDGAKLIAPGVTKVTVTDEASGSCIQLAEEGQVVGKSVETGEEVQVEEGSVVNRGKVEPGTASNGLTIGNAACPDYDKNDFEPGYSSLYQFENTEYYGTEFCSFPNEYIRPGNNVTIMDCTEFDVGHVETNALLNLKSPLKKVNIGSVFSGGTVNFEGSNLEEVSIDDVDAYGYINIAGSSLQTFKFKNVFGGGEVKACSTDGLKVVGDIIYNQGIIHTGPNTTFTVGEVYENGDARKFENKYACLLGIDSGDSAAATTSACGILMATTVAVATALFV